MTMSMTNKMIMRTSGEMNQSSHRHTVISGFCDPSAAGCVPTAAVAAASPVTCCIPRRPNIFRCNASSCKERFNGFYKNISIITSRVCGKGNVFVMSVCVCICACVCVCVCMCVCLSVQAITFERVDIETSF